MRPAIYARVSTADSRQDAENNSPSWRRFASPKAGDRSGNTSTTKAAERIVGSSAGCSPSAAKRQFGVLVYGLLDRLTGGRRRNGAIDQAPMESVSVNEPISIRAESSRMPLSRFSA